MYALFKISDEITLSPRLVSGDSFLKLRSISGEDFNFTNEWLYKNIIGKKYKIKNVLKTDYTYEEVKDNFYWLEPYLYTIQEINPHSNMFRIFNVPAAAFKELDGLFANAKNWDYIHLRKYPSCIKDLAIQNANNEDSYTKKLPLNKMFVWKNSPQGEDFWFNLYVKGWSIILYYTNNLDLISKTQQNNENQLQGEEVTVSRGDNFTGFRVCNQKDQIAIRSGHLKYGGITF